MPIALFRRTDRSALRLNGNNLDRLLVSPGSVSEHLRDDLLAAERDDDDRADVRVCAVGGQRLVRETHVRPELTASGEVRQRGAERQGGRRDALGDDRRADDRGHDEHVIAGADAPVRPAKTEEAGAIVLFRCARHVQRGGRSFARSSAGSARRGWLVAGGASRSPRPRLLATLCVCTCARPRYRRWRCRSDCRT